MDWITVHVLGVIFFATVIRSGFGFGEALIAVPLLALVMPVEVAVPLAVLVSITVAAVIIVQDWRHIHFRSALVLVGFTLLGIPLGLWFLTSIDENVVKALLGIAIVLFPLYCLAGRISLELKDDRHAWLFGFVAGVLGGAYGMNGPPLVVYGSLRRWSPEHFRATLQGYFLPASIAGLLGYWLTGLFVAEVITYYVITLPVTALAIVLGRWINRRLDGRSFITYVHVGLIVIGSALVAQAIWR